MLKIFQKKPIKVILNQVFLYMKKIVLTAILAIATVAVAVAQVGMEFKDNNSGLYFRVTSLNPNRVEVRRNHGVYYTGNIDIPSYVINNRVIYIVTAIESWAFSECSSLKSVNIPNSVTTIGEWAFYRSVIADINVGSSNPRFASDDGILFSKNMDTIICYPRGKTNSTYTIPGSVTAIGEWAFEECGSLTSVNIPNSVITIGRGAFSKCRSLISVNIPNSVTEIGSLAFNECNSLTTVNIGNSVTEIGNQAFEECGSLTSVNIPNSVITIGESAFSKCSSLTSVDIPNSVTEIGWGAFSKCSSLRKIKTDVTNPASITLGNNVFMSIPKGASADACILLVPTGSVPQYSNAPQWKEFMPNIFEPQNFAITYNQPVGGTLAILNAADNSSIPSGSQVEYGDVIKIEATPDNGYHLSHIVVNGEAITGTDITVKRDTYIYAEFAQGTGIDHSDYMALSIYPTLASEYITVATEVGSSPVSVTVTDLSGRTVATAIATGSKTVINISHLSAGTYIVRIGDKVGKVVKR